MSGNVEIKYEVYKLENYIMDILTLEACRLFLPAAFIRAEDGVTASYRTEGYRNLSCFHEMSTEDIFSVALSLMESVEDAERHYIFANEYEITTDSIFVNREFSKTKLLFLPAREDISFDGKIAVLLEKLAEMAPEEGKEYIDDAVRFIRRGDYGYKAVVHHLESLRKEVYLCGIS